MAEYNFLTCFSLESFNKTETERKDLEEYDKNRNWTLSCPLQKIREKNSGYAKALVKKL